jgi:hypothetical protein
MISLAGPYRGLRVTAAIALTALALLVTYSGFTLFAYAAKQPPILPLPPGFSQPATHSPVPDKGHAGIDISPKQQLRCDSADCAQPITIRSIGTAPLMIGTIEIDGEHATDFRPVGHCANTSLKLGDTCTFGVSFTPPTHGTPRHARLVINQNLPGPATFLALEGELPKQQPDLTVSSNGLQCSYTPAKSGSGVLLVRFTLTLAGSEPNPAKQRVRVTAASTSGLRLDARFVAGGPTDPTPSTAILPTRPIHLGRTHLITFTVDPGNEIAESNENNNQITVSVTLPATAKASVLLSCHIQRR